MTRSSTTPPEGKQRWTRPELVKLGTMRDIAQQGPPFAQGAGKFS